MSHTPGPYSVASPHEVNDMDADMLNPGAVGVYAKSDLDNKNECPSALCYVNDNWGECDANARLFGAAPDLLASLQDAIRPFAGDTSPPRWVSIAHAAIAKATGTTPA